MTSRPNAARDATPADVAAMADLAEMKRERYRDHASPFQMPAENAREIHANFLPKLLEWDGFTVLVHESEGTIDGFIVARFGSAPPPFGEGRLLHVDDFAIREAADWKTVGRALLGEVARRANDQGLEKAIVVSGPESVDAPKVRFLIGAGMVVEAEWWVKTVAPSDGATIPKQEGFDAAVGPAPPVYDPGGLTGLALRIDDVEALERFESFAAASGAVVAIVPALRKNEVLRQALMRRNYVVASEWFTAPAAAVTTREYLRI